MAWRSRRANSGSQNGKIQFNGNHIFFCQENPVSICPPNNDFMDMIKIWIMDYLYGNDKFIHCPIISIHPNYGGNGKIMIFNWNPIFS